MELPTDDSISLDLNLTAEQIAQYNNQLNVSMKGKQSSVIARLFKVSCLGVVVVFSFFFVCFFERAYFGESAFAS
jgi:hypothetical protein